MGLLPFLSVETRGCLDLISLDGTAPSLERSTNGPRLGIDASASPSNTLLILTLFFPSITNLLLSIGFIYSVIYRYHPSTSVPVVSFLPSTFSFLGKEIQSTKHTHYSFSPFRNYHLLNPSISPLSIPSFVFFLLLILYCGLSTLIFVPVKYYYDPHIF